jgi:hypothetical protein
MSLINEVAWYLGLTRMKPGQKAKIREEISIMDAINAHVTWKVRLQDYINGKSAEVLDPLVVSRDDQCALGKWIHGQAFSHFHEETAFQQMRDDHAQFHIVAGKVVSCVQAHDQAAAEALLEGEYKQVSHKVVHALSELNKSLNT